MTAPPASFPAVILAGGRATRMGGAPKPLLPLGGRPLLAHLLERLAPQAGPLALNLNADLPAFARFGLPVLPDLLPDWPGPLAGILAAMDWAEDLGADCVLTVAGDTPFLPADLGARLAQARGGSGLALAASLDAEGTPRVHPVIGLWPTGLRGDLRRTLGQDARRVRDFTDRHDPALAVWPAPPDPFENINTPADLARAEARLAGTAR